MFKLDASITIQRQLIFAALDDFQPNDSLAEIYSGKYGNTKEEWEMAVIDFIYNATGLGLIAPLKCIHGFEKMSTEEIKSLLCESKPSSGSNRITNIIWDILYFVGTDKLEIATDKFGIKNWDALKLPVNLNFFNNINMPDE